MSDVNHISNNNILQSTLLSNMAYMEYQLLHQAKTLQQNLVSDERTKNFIKNNQYSYGNIVIYSELYLKELTEDENYKNIIKQRLNFYCLFKNELKLNNLDYKYIEKIATEDSVIEIKKNLLTQFVNFIDEISENDVDYIKDFQSTEIKTNLLKNRSKAKQVTSEDIEQFSEKFIYMEFSECIKEKFRYFRNYGGPEIHAEFSNGYVNVGKVGKVKDTSFLVGYTEENDGNILHVSFRGTERKLKSALMYFLENYPNIEKEYNHLEPILKEIIQEEINKNKNRNNKNGVDKPLRVIFTGHSLGASIAEKALSKFQNTEDVKFNAILISNPGSFHYMQKIVNKLDEIENNIDLSVGSSKFTMFKKLGVKAVTKTIKATVLVLVGLSNYVVGSLEYGFKEIETSQTNEAIIKGLTLRTAKLLNDGMLSTLSASKYICFKALGYLKLVNTHEADPRMLTINHKRDNIPLLGKALFQNRNPQEIKLKSLIEEVETFINPWKRVFHLEYHKPEHYYKELKQMDDSNSNILDKINKIRKDSIEDSNTHASSFNITQSK